MNAVNVATLFAIQEYLNVFWTLPEASPVSALNVRLTEVLFSFSVQFLTPDEFLQQFLYPLGVLVGYFEHDRGRCQNAVKMELRLAHGVLSPSEYHAKSFITAIPVKITGKNNRLFIFQPG